MKYNKINFYYDQERKEVSNAMDLEQKTGLRPHYHRKRFVHVGEFQTNQKQPYMNKKGKVVRDHYGEQVIIYDPEN